MAHKYIVDTHALVWYLEGNSRLGNAAYTVLADPDSELILPLIALAEAAFLIQKKRIGIPSVADLLRDLDQDKRISITPITREIFERSLTEDGLAIPELHDRLIVSTGLALQDQGDEVSILTKDERIVEAGVLPVVW